MLSKIPNDGCTAVVVATSSEKVNTLWTPWAGRSSSRPKTRRWPPARRSCRSTSRRDGRHRSSRPIPRRGRRRTRTTGRRCGRPRRPCGPTAGRGRGVAAPRRRAPSRSRAHPVVFGVPETMATRTRLAGQADRHLPTSRSCARTRMGWGASASRCGARSRSRRRTPTPRRRGSRRSSCSRTRRPARPTDLTAADVAAAEDFSRVVRGVRDPLRRHHRQGAARRCTTRPRTARAARATSRRWPLEETSLLNYNQGNPDSHTVQPGEKLKPPKEKLVAVYPAGGSMWSDNPVTVSRRAVGDPVQRRPRARRSPPSCRPRPRSRSCPSTASGRSTSRSPLGELLHRRRTASIPRSPP